jgi:hypothetical protein
MQHLQLVTLSEGYPMYVPMVIALMFLFPLIAIAAQMMLTDHGALTAAVSMGIVAKWYVFSAVGVRLSLAGLRQMFQPRFTAQAILGINNPDALFLVRELGIANVAMGTAGLGTLLAPAWLPPVELTGAIFFGVAGINHWLIKGRNKLQNLALVSDLFAAVVLATCFFA